MSTSTTTAEAERYLAAVRAHLADVGEDERADLLEDLEQHLAEVAAEFDGPLDAQLGSPESYAAELRASADLLPAAPSAPDAMAARVAARVAALRRHDLVAQAIEFLRDLRPAWLVARGYLIVAVGSLDSYGFGPAFPIPRFGGSRAAGLVMTLVAVGFSVWIDRRRTAPARAVGALVTLAGLFAGLVVVASLNDATIQASAYARGDFQDGATAESYGRYGEFNLSRVGLVRADGRAVTNLYAFDEAGKPLSNVRLYDQAGKPVNIVLDYHRGRPVFTSFPTDAEGDPVANAFPQRQAMRGRDGGFESTTAISPPNLTVPALDGPATQERRSDAPADGERRGDPKSRDTQGRPPRNE